MRRAARAIAWVVLLGILPLMAQHPFPPGGEPPPDGGGPHGPPRSGDHPPGRPFGGPPGMWWRDSNLTRKIGLTADQTKQIEDLFQQSRPKLIDLSGALQKQEAALEPLIEADHPDESRVVQQIDRIAQARAELEKARARMLLGIRGVLRQDQWKNLQSMAPPPGDGRR